jgi:hypothetical protein
MKRLLQLLPLIAVLAIGTPAHSQFIYMDTSGDGISSSLDCLTSNVTVVHVYLNTNHNRDGSVATCVDGTNPFDMASYDLIFHSGGSGSVTYNGWTNGSAMSGFTLLDAFTVAGNDAGVGYQGPTYLAPGLYELGQLSVTVTGSPGLSWVGTSNTPSIPSPVTGFGSHCSGTDNPNTITLGLDFFDNGGTCLPDPVESTTWGKIKQLYK